MALNTMGNSSGRIDEIEKELKQLLEELDILNGDLPSVDPTDTKKLKVFDTHQIFLPSFLGGVIPTSFRKGKGIPVREGNRSLDLDSELGHQNMMKNAQEQGVGFGRNLLSLIAFSSKSKKENTRILIAKITKLKKELRELKGVVSAEILPKQVNIILDDPTGTEDAKIKNEEHF